MNAHDRSRRLSASAIDFPLTAVERHELAEHLQACFACRDFDAAVRGDAEGLTGLAVQPAPSALRAVVAGYALMDGNPPGSGSRRTRGRPVIPVMRPFAAGIRVALLLALMAALILGLALSAFLAGHRGLAVVVPRPSVVEPTASPDRGALLVRVVGPTIVGCPNSQGLRPGAGAIWLLCPGEIWRADTSSGKVTAKVTGAGDVTDGGGGTWAVGSDAALRLDPATGMVTSRIAGAGGNDVAVTTSAVWIANTTAGTVSRVDAGTGKVVTTIKLSGGPQAIAADGRAVWVASRETNTVTRIDPSTNRIVATIAVGRGPTSISIADGAAWVVNDADGTVSRIDPATNRTDLIGVDPGTIGDVLPASAVQSGRWLWVIDAHASSAPTPGAGATTLVRIDLTGASPLARVVVSGLPSVAGFAGDSLVSIAVVDGQLWAADARGFAFRLAP